MLCQVSELSLQPHQNSKSGKRNTHKQNSNRALHCSAYAWAYSFSLRKAKKDQAMAYHSSEAKTFSLPNTVKVPHMGWNTLNIVKQNELFDGISRGTLCLLCPFTLPRARRQKHCLHTNRIRNNLHISSSPQKHLRHPVSPRKIRRHRTQNPQKLRQNTW